MLCCQRITGRLIGCYIWGYIWRLNPHGEGRGRGKFDFLGMVGRMAAGMVSVVVVSVVVWVRVSVFWGCNLTGCKVATL